MNLRSFLSSMELCQEKLFRSFQKRHEILKSENSVWTMAATRRRLISSFWFKEVLLDHYLLIVMMGTVFTWLFHAGQPVESLLVAAIPAYVLVFVILFVSMYYPIYHDDFLTQVDNWLENYNSSLTQNIQICKRQQYSVVALMLIEVTDRELRGLSDLVNNTTIDLILARKYGISAKSVNSALNLINRGTWDKKSVRKRTEILDDFETAQEHFTKLSQEKAVLLLAQRQQKLLQEPGK